MFRLPFKISRQSAVKRDQDRLTWILDGLTGGGRPYVDVEPRDVWFGVFWDWPKDRTSPLSAYKINATYRYEMPVWVCLFPCVVVRFIVHFGSTERLTKDAEAMPERAAWRSIAKSRSVWRVWTR